MDGKIRKGEHKGRKPGVQNRVTTTVKANVIAVFELIGGQDRMSEWASDNLTQFYRLYAKLLPLQVDAEIKHVTDRLSDSELTDLIIADSKAKEDKDQAIRH